MNPFKVDFSDQSDKKKGRSRMADIIKFPLNDERNWHEFEKIIRNSLSEGCAPSGMIEYVCTNLRKVYLAKVKGFQVNVTAPHGDDVREAIHEAVNQVVSNYREIANGLLFELMLREIELYKYKGENKKI